MMRSANFKLLFMFISLLISSASKRSLFRLKRSAWVAVFVSNALSLLPLVDKVYANDTPITDNASVTSARRIKGKTEVDGEANRIFRKARQIESDGDQLTAMKLYEQIVVAEPDFIYGWSNLGNVLSATGNLEQALLCYKKAILLQPPPETLSVIILNKASVENGLNHLETALKDLNVAESIAGPTQTLLSNKAVILSGLGRWKEACDIFEKIISSSDRYALPWWLRYSMSLLETGRGMVYHNLFYISIPKSWDLHCRNRLRIFSGC